MNGKSQAPSPIARAYIAACRAEIEALKPGNVHAFGDGHGMSITDFFTSAEVSAPALAQPGAPVGRRVRGAVAATIAAVGCNTNLGILLLAAPLAAAAERGGDLGLNLARVLQALDEADAADVYAAIRLANPGGLGRADEHDVSEPPHATLRQAMAAASERDRIARAYVTGFADLFEVGLPALAEARGRCLDAAWCGTSVYFAYLTRFPDTHIVRKYGLACAEGVRSRAAALLRSVELGPPAFARLLAFDAELKREKLNPGTSADFTVATLFADALLDLRLK